MAGHQPIVIRKKKSQAHAHHGGAWKVAYADFVTAMMAFFMVMWIMGLSENDRQLIAGYFNDPLGFTKTSTRAPVTISPENDVVNKAQKSDSPTSKDAARAELEEVERKVEEKLIEEQKQGGEAGKLAEGVTVTVTPEGLMIEFIENDESGVLFFELGSAKIRPAAAELIAMVAPILQESGRSMFIDGHTDARPYQTPGYDNYDLSQDRANAVRRELIASGLDNERVAGVRGFADRRLKRPEDPYHHGNRRVTVLLPHSLADAAETILPGDGLERQIEGGFLIEKPEAPRLGAHSP